MTGREVVQIVETELSKRWIGKAKFYKESGISSATFSQWRTGVYDPSPEMIKRIEDYLGIKLDSYGKSSKDQEIEDLLQTVRERQDLRVLLHSAKGVPPSSVYALIAQLEREKENDG